MQKVVFQDLGLKDFKDAWSYQEELLNRITSVKRENNGKQLNPLHYLLFCEHPHVYTLGKSGDQANLLIEQAQMDQNDAEFFKINRGGDITYHGPGQLVGYPILDLDFFFHDIHKYLRYLEDAIILTLMDFGITAGKIEKLTGVWVDPEDKEKARKICAFGVRCSRWVTMHGFALNVNTDLSYFKNIIPCGIEDKAVTSMQNELGKEVDIEVVKSRLKLHLSEIFQFEIINEEY
jgi:lipoyl(octanoyl) transferase